MRLGPPLYCSALCANRSVRLGLYQPHSEEPWGDGTSDDVTRRASFAPACHAESCTLMTLERAHATTHGNSSANAYAHGNQQPHHTHSNAVNSLPPITPFQHCSVLVSFTSSSYPAFPYQTELSKSFQNILLFIAICMA